ncbi:hypothetical protein HanLR1_Chr09g0300961 [Helianthus annuus]|nr:hypothetical protein HanLR1_Chr09g0300961 [Helianthus annuus]
MSFGLNRNLFQHYMRRPKKMRSRLIYVTGEMVYKTCGGQRNHSFPPNRAISPTPNPRCRQIDSTQPQPLARHHDLQRLESSHIFSTACSTHHVHCTRTMQTAVGAFGGEATAVGIDVSPLMAENMGNSNRPAISSLNCPPFIAVELCQEDMGIHPCDRRRRISEYKSMFLAIDFSLIKASAI